MSEYTTIEDILTGADVVKDDGEFTVKNVLDDFKQAYEGKKRLIDAMQEDYEFALGKQWDPDDVKTLEEAGVRALTINIISPNLQLLRGIESQNRSEFKAFPEGQEDTVSAEIATRLMKNAIKLSDLDYKISEMFDDGNTCGESYLEPWIEYPYNMKDDGTIDLLGRLKFTKQYFDQIYPDPAAREYDLSDADYVCKYTADVSKEKLISMFPDMKDEIEEMNTGKIVVDSVFPERDQQGMDVQRAGYDEDGSSTLSKKDFFDLLDYYYVKHVPKYYVADFKLKAVRKFKNKKEADRYVAKATERDKNKKKPTAKVIERFEKEVWVCFVTGGMDKFLGAGPAWSYPNWKSWPFFGYYAYKSGAPLDETDREYLIQGITRKVKDHQREKNKRRTQELRHLNQSANSGWQGEEDAFVDEPKWENFGATPGVILKHRKGAIPPQKIMPTPLSQGHAQLAEEHAKDTRDALGIEREALALQSDQSITPHRM